MLLVNKEKNCYPPFSKENNKIKRREDKMKPS